MNMRTMQVADIDRAAYNPRRQLKPGDPDWRRLQRSLTEFGAVIPLVWNCQTSRLVAGHQRLSVLEAEGVTEVDVVEVDLDPDREKALNVALNAIRGGWDEEALSTVLDELCDAGLSDLTGFTDVEVRRLTGQLAAEAAELDGLVDPDDIFSSEPAADADTAEPAVTVACPRCGHEQAV